MDNPKKSATDAISVLGLAGQLGYAIALPIVLLALAGRFIDRRLDTSPCFLLTGTILAIVISSVWVTKKAMAIQRDLNIKK